MPLRISSQGAEQMSITYRLYQPNDVEQVVGVVGRAFPHVGPFTVAAWQKLESRDHVTVVADDGGRIAGAIPFDLRDFLVRPGVVLRVAVAHAVAVDAPYRNQGVGSAMMSFAKAEFPAGCDAMFVYTGGEGRAPYTFYQRNGFVDLMYSRPYRLSDLPAATPSGIRVTPFDAAGLGPTLDATFQSAYAASAGFARRGPGYWQRALESIIYVEIPYDFRIAYAGSATDMAGYAIFGLRQDYAALLEVAVRPEAAGVIADLLQAVSAAAAANGAKEVRLIAPVTHPAVAALQAMGCQGGSRSAGISVLAGQVLSFESVWRKLGGEGGPALHVWTPRQENAPGREFDLVGQGAAVTLEMKRSTAHRLFLCREDIQASVAAERITSPEPALPLAQLANTFRPAPWIYHYIEWI